MARRQTIRVLLADDHEMVRAGLSQILEECEGIEVVGQAGDGVEALAVAAQTRPDVVVLDYSMPKADAPTVIDDLRRQNPGARILILTVHEDIHYALRVLEMGAHGYVIKAAAVGELVDALVAVRRGEIYISPRISQKIMERLRSPRKDRSGLESLSTREFDLLRALGAGMGVKACARHLNISTSTVSTYRARLMEKLGLETTAEIIRFALENKIVS